jgi:hypothetical protein
MPFDIHEGVSKSTDRDRSRLIVDYVATTSRTASNRIPSVCASESNPLYCKARLSSSVADFYCDIVVQGLKFVMLTSNEGRINQPISREESDSLLGQQLFDMACEVLDELPIIVPQSSALALPSHLVAFPDHSSITFSRYLDFDE